MSTRSAIMRHEEGGGRGVYHHWDGYPSGLGVTLVKLYFGHFGEDVELMTKELIDVHPAGWSTLNSRDLTKPAGFGSVEGPPCYCHGDRSEDGNEIICIDDPLRPGYCSQAGACDPLFIEWEYRLSHEGIEVWGSVRDAGTREEQGYGGTTYQSPNYVHRKVGKVAWSLGAEEADLAMIGMEQVGRAMKDAAYLEHEEERT
jgi:hypothetical protein